MPFYGPAATAYRRKLALDDKPATRRLLQVIGVGLAGLFYYLGLVVRHLHDQGLPFERMSDVYVGGNGCRLFHWVANGSISTVLP